MKTKKCRVCGETKGLSEFHRKTKSKDGVQSACKPCNIKTATQAYRDNPKKTIERATKLRNELVDFVHEVKRKHGCLNCGEKEPVCLDFHHTSNDKVKSVATLAWNKNKTQLIKEMAKCIVLCSNCHRKLHAGLITLGS